MSKPLFVGFAGSWNTGSKTRSLVTEATRRAAESFDGTAHVFDIADLGDSFGALHPKDDTEYRRHLEMFLKADGLIVASSVYKGSYTGLFKHFIDLLEPDALIDKPVLLAAVGGGERHSLMIEHQMRPIFGFFEAHTLATGLYVSAKDFTGEELTAPAALARLDRAVAQFGVHLGRPALHPANQTV